MSPAAPGPDAGRTICPTCGQRNPIRLQTGQVCAACQSRDAWAQFDSSGGSIGSVTKIVIDDAAIADAVARRAPPDREIGWVERLGHAALSLMGLACAALGGAILAAWFEPQPAGPLGPMFDRLDHLSLAATVAGAVGVAVALAGLWRLRRTRLFRDLTIVALHLVALVGSAGVGIASAVGYLSTLRDASWQYLDGAPQTVTVAGDFERTRRAAVSIIAPDEDGDARRPSLGSGAVIAGDEHRAWILTCSHVAMPYAAVGSKRDPADAHSLWITFADGRGAVGHVQWTAEPPLDVALVRAELSDPPRPVELADTAADLIIGSPVTFVPNPMRRGWMVHTGAVIRRISHDSPAGRFSLVHTDLPVQSGDSGSGLMDEYGRLAGLNTWALRRPGRSEGISLPTEAMQAIVAAIEADRIDALDQTLSGSKTR